MITPLFCFLGETDRGAEYVEKSPILIFVCLCLARSLDDLRSPIRFFKVYLLNLLLLRCLVANLNDFF